MIDSVFKYKIGDSVILMSSAEVLIVEQRKFVDKGKEYEITYKALSKERSTAFWYSENAILPA